MNAAEVGTAFFTTPGAPADRVTALRRAFDATMKDPELLSEAERMKVGISPLPGEELQKLVADVAAISPLPCWTRSAPPTARARRIDGACATADWARERSGAASARHSKISTSYFATSALIAA